MSSKKLSAQNILTGVIVGLAVILVTVVILVKAGVIGTPGQHTTEEETVVESSVVVVSETQEDGSVVYLTMVTKYFKPKYSSNHTYPTTKPKPTTTTVPYIDMSTVVHATDVDGNPLYDENGVPVTELVTYSVPSTTAEESTTEFVPRTSAVQVTDKLHRPVYDENGNPVTETVTLDAPPTTKAPLWTEAPSTEETTTGKINIDFSGGVSRDDVLASTIITQLNEDRAQFGLAALDSGDTNLTMKARTNSLGLAKPETYGEPNTAGASTFVTEYGGQQLYKDIKSSLESKAMSVNTTKIAVGIVKYQEKYYTTVIFE